MQIIFTLHSLWRWVVLLAALAVIIKALLGWFGRQPWTDLDNRLGLFFTVAFDIQVLLGLIVYIGTFTGAHVQRWYGGSIGRLTGEHVALMFIALVIAHLTRSRARKAEAAVSKHQTAAIGFVISLILVVVGMPTWSFSFQ
jgi:hypothetical protein